ncbi:MAG TPA: metal ABC transporter substrate-binding protein, partial [bacterium]|nr:metal ABC transporter substrate-binding protein [bacterium]
MKRVFFLSVVFCLLWSAVTNCQVVVTTTSLKAVVTEIAENTLSVDVLVASGLCPGHADVSIEKMALLEKSSLFLAHGFEPYLSRLEKSVRQMEKKKRLIILEGNWQIPSVHRQAARLVAEVLTDYFPEKRTVFRKNLEKLDAFLSAFETRVLKQVREKGLQGVAVISNVHLTDLLGFLGLRVVGSYGTREELTPSLMAELVRKGQAAGVRMVIDNLQAGPDTGRGLAEELKAAHLVFSNFLEGESLPALLERNLK